MIAYTAVHHFLGIIFEKFSCDTALYAVRFTPGEICLESKVVNIYH